MSEDKTGTRSFEIAVSLNATPHQAWQVISEAEEIQKWFAPEAKVVPGVGGSIYVSWGGDASGTMEITVWEEDKRLRMEDTRGVAVDYFIETAAGGETVLRLVQSGFGEGANWDAELESTSRGWVVFLRAIKHYVERHWGEPARQLTIAAQSSAGPDEVWERLMSEQGLLGRGSTRPQATGARYSFRSAKDDVLVGEVFKTGHRYFAGSVDNLNNALLAITGEGYTDKPGSVLYFMLTTYSMTDSEIKAIETRWSAALEEAIEADQVRTH